MALSIKTDEADRLARALARLTGETMTEAVTVALRERLARQRAHREAAAELPARLAALSRRLRADYDMRPVSRAEWDEASGEDAA
jgi:antitoxin VapB